MPRLACLAALALVSATVAQNDNPCKTHTDAAACTADQIAGGGCTWCKSSKGSSSCFTSCATPADASDCGGYLVLNTTLGEVQGVLWEKDNATRMFLGIPYAADTSGAGRFLPPRARTPWGENTFQATSYGPGCAQSGHNFDVPKVVSEDCLNVNVFVPPTASQSNLLPVGLFFHGGVSLAID